jgi:hypothetical protein
LHIGPTVRVRQSRDEQGRKGGRKGRGEEASRTRIVTPFTCHELPSLLEDLISQIPALQLLQNLGWSYVTPAESVSLRIGSDNGSEFVCELLMRWLPVVCATSIPVGEETRKERI